MLEDDIRLQLAGLGPWTDKNDVSVRSGLIRALRRTGRRSPRLVTALVWVLVHGTLQERTLLVDVIVHTADVVGSTAIATALSEHPELFYGVPPKDPEGYDQPAGHDLASHLLMALGRAGTQRDERAAKVLRDALERYGPREWVHRAIAQGDPDWFVEHVAAVVPETQWTELLRVLRLERLQRRFLLAVLQGRAPETWDRFVAHDPSWQSWRAQQPRALRLERFIRRTLTTPDS